MSDRDLYQESGVDYDWLDRGKRAAVGAALTTSDWLAQSGGRAYDESRGESAFVFEVAGTRFAFVMECLGTKSLLTQSYYELTGEDHFSAVAYDGVAAIANDLCSVGALPLVVNAYFATGGSDWYKDEARSTSVVKGWKAGCDAARCVWGGGESPSLIGLLKHGALEIAGSAVGATPDGAEAILGQDLRAGDAIIFVRSSGLHANGAALARHLVDRLDDGLLTALPSGETVGQGLLRPSIVYVALVRELLRRGLRPTYLSHVTGHGLLKVMRAQKAFTYRIETLPPVPPILDFLRTHASMDDRTAYRTLNMGIGYTVFCRPGDVDSVLAAGGDTGYECVLAGEVCEGPRSVDVPQLGFTYTDDELQFA